MVWVEIRAAANRRGVLLAPRVHEPVRGAAVAGRWRHLSARSNPGLPLLPAEGSRRMMGWLLLAAFCVGFMAGHWVGFGKGRKVW
mgnify:FL=1